MEGGRGWVGCKLLFLLVNNILKYIYNNINYLDPLGAFRHPYLWSDS